MRMSTAVLALACVVTGFVLAGTQVRAVEDVSPARFPNEIVIGARVAVSLDGKKLSCTIARVDVGWFQCAPEGVDPFKMTERPEWYSIAQVSWVQRLQSTQ